jgi:pSer/pThr/pTyr-binding forkhead associated (FHA) protein
VGSGKRTPDGDRGGLSTTAIIEREGVEAGVRRGAEDAPWIQVEVVGGPMDGERRRLSTASFTIGRGETNDLVLRQDPTISTRHARIVREGGHFWLEDLESSNGTFIGDRRIRGRALVGAGSVFLVGRTPLEFMPS